MKRLCGILCLFTLFCVASLAFAFENVLLVSSDTTRSDYLSCYGSRKIKTPHIDSMAANGVVFKNTVSPIPFTLPSHVSILTGEVPPVHGVEDNSGFYLDHKVNTLAKVFKSKGMQTGAFVGAFPLDSRFGLDQGFDVYDDAYPTVNDLSDLAMPERPAEEVVENALKWLGAQTNKRWFAFIHLYDPHFPYHPPERFKAQYPNDPYAAEIAYIDDQLGRLLAFLKEKQLEKKTLVVFVSDHGEGLGDHEEKTHGIFAYESTLRVPFIVAPFPPKVVETRVRLIDVAPTILALQKLSFPNRVQGVSLAKSVEGQKVVEPNLQDGYFEALSMYFNMQWAPLRGFYSRNYKFIDLPIPELYDLSKDSQETTNLCKQDKQLCNFWAHRYEVFSKPFLHKLAAPAPVDEETAEQLKALGYVSTRIGPPKEKFGAEDDPKNLISLHNRIDVALAWFKKGYDLKALEILQEIIKQKPDYTLAYMHTSFIQSDTGFPQKAVETLQEALERGVTGSNLFAKLGLYLYESGRYEEAIKHLKVALENDPKNIDVWNHLGMAYTANSNYVEAESTFQRALTVDSSDSMTMNNLGTLYLKQKKPDLAQKKFEEALARNPHITNAHNGLGVIYASQKKWDDAIRSWSLALEADKKNYDAMLNLAYAYLEKKEKEKALALFQDFRKNAPISRYGPDLRKVNSLIRQLQ